jgi:hypothetical protein
LFQYLFFSINQAVASSKAIFDVTVWFSGIKETPLHERDELLGSAVGELSSKHCVRATFHEIKLRVRAKEKRRDC